MKLFIMIFLYLCICALSLLLLAGLLRRALDPEKNRPLLRAIPTIITGLLLAFPLVGALLPDGPLCHFFQRWGNVFLGYLLYFFGPLLLIRIGVRLCGLIRRIAKKPGPVPKRGLSAALLLCLLILSVSLNLFGARKAAEVQVTRYELPRETLSQERPLRIVLIADLHIGVNSDIQLMKDMTARVNEQEPDLVLVAGDLLTSSFSAMRDPAAYAAVLKQIHAPEGVFVVYGNHDVDEPLLGGFTYVGPEGARRNPGMAAFLEDCGWTLLEDELLTLPERNGLIIAGRRDESRPGDGIPERASLAGLLADTDPASPILLLEHEPAELTHLSDYGIDLAVSGHTHDGQIFPGNFVVRLFADQSYGLRRWNDTQVLVTSGVGFYGPPIRVGTISEIVVVDLQ